MQGTLLVKNSSKSVNESMDEEMSRGYLGQTSSDSRDTLGTHPTRAMLDVPFVPERKRQNNKTVEDSYTIGVSHQGDVR